MSTIRIHLAVEHQLAPGNTSAAQVIRDFDAGDNPIFSAYEVAKALDEFMNRESDLLVQRFGDPEDSPR